MNNVSKNTTCLLQQTSAFQVLAHLVSSLVTMGGGRGRGRYSSPQPKGKGLGAAAPRAVPKEATVHLDVLQAFPGEDGSILIHRHGARSDSQLLEKNFLLQLLTKDSHELLNRPSKGLSMLCGAMTHGAVARPG